MRHIASWRNASWLGLSFLGLSFLGLSFLGPFFFGLALSLATAEAAEGPDAPRRASPSSGSSPGAETTPSLSDELETLVAAYRRAGAKVHRHPAHFAEPETPHRVSLGATGKGCRTVVALTTRSRGLRLQMQRGTAPLGSPRTGRAGVAVFEDCAGLADGVAVSVLGGRAAVELLSVSHVGNLPDVDVVLPRRAVGPLAEVGRSDGPMPLALAAARRARAVEAAQRDRARRVVTAATVRADDDGEGAVQIDLAAGCHRFVVVSDQNTAAGGDGDDDDPVVVDVDIEVSDPDRDRRIGRDTSHAPDGRLDFCRGRDGRVGLRFAGAGRGARVVVVAAYWPLPEGLPRRWGPTASAGLAWALHRRPTPSPRRPPARQYLGAAGRTRIPVPVVPGMCYLAAFAAAQGDARAGRITVDLGGGGPPHYDEAAGEQVVGAVSFCAERAMAASVQIELQARQGWWVMALWAYGDAVE